MSSRCIVLAALVLAAFPQFAGAAEQTRQATVVQDLAPSPPAGPVPVPYPNQASASSTGAYPGFTGGVRVAVGDVNGEGPGGMAGGARVLYQDLQVPPSAKFGSLGSLKSVGSANELFANSRGGDQGQHHAGGANFSFGDGSVRNGNGTPAGGFTTADPSSAGMKTQNNLKQLGLGVHNNAGPSPGGGPHVKVFDASNRADTPAGVGARALKGATIRPN